MEAIRQRERAALLDLMIPSYSDPRREINHAVGLDRIRPCGPNRHCECESEDQLRNEARVDGEGTNGSVVQRDSGPRRSCPTLFIGYIGCLRVASEVQPVPDPL